MDRSAFHALLKKYLEGRCTEEEERIIQQWYDLIDDDRPYIIESLNLDQLENTLWLKIQDRAKLAQPLENLPRKVFSISTRFRWIAAAAIILALSGIWLYSTITSSSSSNDWVIKTNKTGLTEIVILEDGSRVSLKPNARIEYPSRFSTSSREVFLEGEAFFEVKRDPQKAFFVYNNNLVTEVLGTSFNIIIRNNKIEVEVKTGRVAVYENGKRVQIKDAKKEESKIIVTPNQKVIYDNQNRHFTTAIADTPVVLTPPDARKLVSFQFDETPLSEVLNALETTYGIEISLENANMKLCPFSGDISRQNLYTKLDFICQAFHATYEIKGVRILIKGGKECN